ncbi:MAG: cytochrome c biogenesis CcdA family protein [Armatimonadota bacterium]
MEQLFIALTRAVEGTPMVALGASFVWGILSILLSPCHLASIPLIVGFIDGQGLVTTRRAFWLSAVFASGILVTIALIGVITAGLGRLIGDVGPWGDYFVAVVFFVVGLHLMDIIPLNFEGATPGQTQRKGLLAALVLGLIFGIALGPCTFAYMAPMLAVTLRVATESFVYGALLLLVFGVGHCSVIVAAGTSTEAVQGYLEWTEESRGAVIVKRICGALVILGGLYMLYTA